MEPTSELMRALRRQRTRIGEGDRGRSPLSRIENKTPENSKLSPEEAWDVKVKQRCIRRFESDNLTRQKLRLPGSVLSARDTQSKLAWEGGTKGDGDSSGGSYRESTSGAGCDEHEATQSSSRVTDSAQHISTPLHRDNAVSALCSAASQDSQESDAESTPLERAESPHIKTAEVESSTELSTPFRAGVRSVCSPIPLCCFDISTPAGGSTMELPDMQVNSLNSPQEYATFPRCFNMSPVRNGPTSPDETPRHWLVVEDTSCASATESLSAEKCPEDSYEPMEYIMLPYLHELPAGFADKVKGNLEMHDKTIQRLRKTNRQLRKKVLERSAGDGGVEHAQQCDENGREGRPQRTRASSRPAPAEAALRREADMHEASVRSRPLQTCKEAEDRITAITRRAERTEKECRVKEHIAKQEHGQLRQDLETASEELTKTESHTSDLEESVRVTHARCREKNAQREPLFREAELLRNDLLVHSDGAGTPHIADNRLWAQNA
eukprot:CAMPEP_0194544804 /NCGR_PEP_ID=MMETSP0253-20130528/88145_1 /TAXON_ID=2966 /ORGANISM="Noctiluca scintillans" /LENGTH=495 /DNA_ID=CAMNT_0039391731 /DNA_START=44 /DNA_END=1531 /DNA_ORIENTATION=+